MISVLSTLYIKSVISCCNFLFLNTLLGYLGFGPFNFLYNDGAVILGMIYNFLPFMVILAKEPLPLILRE